MLGSKGKELLNDVRLEIVAWHAHAQEALDWTDVGAKEMRETHPLVVVVVVDGGGADIGMRSEDDDPWFRQRIWQSMDSQRWWSLFRP